MTKLMYVLIFIVFLDTFIQLPMMTPYALSLGASAALAGVVVSMYSLMNIAGNIIGGAWIDRAGRKPVLLAGMISVAAVILLYPLAQNGWQLVAVRFLHGLAGGLMIPAAFALIGDRSSSGSRKMMAYAGAAIGISAVTGPALGGILASRGQYELVFYVTFILFAAGIVLALFFVRETSIPQKKKQQGRWRNLLHNRQLMQASLAAFSLMVSNGVLAFALPLAAASAGFSTAASGALLSTYGITALLIFITPLNGIYQRAQPVSLVVSGIGIIAVSMTLLHAAEGIVLLACAMIVYGVGFAFIFPSMNQMTAVSVEEADRGKAYGLFYACFSFGVVAGSAGAGFVTDHLGIPFLLTAGFLAAAAAVLFFLRPGD
ncbi:MFS transporter [Alkalicoccus urumqiensis]|uniref:MFS transporter n=1 Tax=Alkalicoccus urumqiensis TaxID=1548213 RepID=A0A2P6MHZ5_ALKUR|nr:MFS transporter [Alkalicoccus urumqiensis]PRO65906.1 MFS transporter [Alkalicoccus urumqiensis]